MDSKSKTKSAAGRIDKATLLALELEFSDSQYKVVDAARMYSAMRLMKNVRSKGRRYAGVAVSVIFALIVYVIGHYYGVPLLGWIAFGIFLAAFLCMNQLRENAILLANQNYADLIQGKPEYWGDLRRRLESF